MPILNTDILFTSQRVILWLMSQICLPFQTIVHGHIPFCIHQSEIWFHENHPEVRFTIFTSVSITGTSVNTPTVVARAAGLVVPNGQIPLKNTNSRIAFFTHIYPLPDKNLISVFLSAGVPSSQSAGLSPKTPHPLARWGHPAPSSLHTGREHSGSLHCSPWRSLHPVQEYQKSAHAMLLQQLFYIDRFQHFPHRDYFLINHQSRHRHNAISHDLFHICNIFRFNAKPHLLHSSLRAFQ